MQVNFASSPGCPASNYDIVVIVGSRNGWLSLTANEFILYPFSLVLAGRGASIAIVEPFHGVIGELTTCEKLMPRTVGDAEVRRHSIGKVGARHRAVDKLNLHSLLSQVVGRRWGC